MKRLNRYYFFMFIFFIAQGLMLGLNSSTAFSQERTEPLIIDHTCTDLLAIPEEWINQAKNDLKIWYGHTSHGSQPITGMEVIESHYGSPYTFNYSGSGGALSLQEVGGDLGHNGDLGWASETRNRLNQSGNDRNVVIWSWCGGVSDNTEAGINIYLNAMNQLESDYPDVTFIYMTGHLDGGGESGNLNIRNEQIRAYCLTNNKILYDFTDIESYDPDGNYFLDRGADDECYYDNRSRNWAVEWCAAHPGSELCLDCDCAHSEPLNCALKARAFWWMLARLAGWGESPPASSYSVSPQSLTFGLVYIDSSQTQIITISNTGSDAVTIDSLALDNPAFALAVILKKKTIPGFTLEVGESRDVAVTFSPQAAQSYAGTLTIYSAQAGNKTVYLSGQGRDISPNTELIQPGDLEYKGAFRLPDETPDEKSWAWGGSGMTYYPDGDPNGAADGYPGSIFGIGHDWTMYVSEISIPVPVISPTKSLSDLNTATTLQGFADVRADLFSGILTEMLCAGIEYLPKQGSQTTAKLHIAWGQLQQYDQDVSHTWCELDLSNPQTAGAWYFDNCYTAGTNDYIFEIPKSWADSFTPGKYLASGRFQEGGLSGRGPALYAYGPWLDGNPPAQNSMLQNISTLLLYDNYDVWENPDTLNNYNPADEWIGGAWLEAGSAAAIIFAGTKKYGATNFQGQLLFYDPADLASVVNGTVEPGAPQPYATLNIDQYLFHANTNEPHHLRAVCFDRARRLLYLFEPHGDGDKPLTHVWSIQYNVEINESETGNSESKFVLSQNYPNPFNQATTIAYSIPKAVNVKITVYNVLGEPLISVVEKYLQAGSYRITWNGKNSMGQQVSSGIYFYSIKCGDFVKTKKILLLK